jgi:hypothetical protein
LKSKKKVFVFDHFFYFYHFLPLFKKVVQNIVTTFFILPLFTTFQKSGAKHCHNFFYFTTFLKSGAKHLAQLFPKSCLAPPFPKVD